MLMRKTGITTAAAALVLLCGCTQQDMVSTFEMSDYRITLTSDNAVDVNVSTSEGGQTRASYDDITDGHLSGDGIGIFCLPARKINPTASDINWFKNIEVNGGEVTYANGIYWDNVKFKVGDLHSTKNDKNYHKLEMVEDHDILEYYPLISNYGYDFYGYAPYQEGTLKDDTDADNFGYAVEYMTVAFTIDGSHDIIYGRSKAPEGDLANRNDYYSARYFRQTSQASAVEMDFEHKLTRLNFYVNPEPDGEGSYESVDQLAVKSIKLYNVVTHVNLYIADKTEHNRAGKLVVGKPKAVTDFISLRGTGWTTVTDKLLDIDHEQVVNDKLKVGEHLMVYPEKQYEMEIILCDKDDHTKVFPARRLTLALNGGAAFKPGYQYNINIGVSGPVAINLISAQLIDWNTEEGNSDVDVSYGE